MAAEAKTNEQRIASAIALLTENKGYAEAQSKLANLQVRLQDVEKQIDLIHVHRDAETMAGNRGRSSQARQAALAMLDGKVEVKTEPLGKFYEERKVLLEAVSIQQDRVKMLLRELSIVVCKAIAPVYRELCSASLHAFLLLAESELAGQKLLRELRENDVSIGEPMRDMSILEGYLDLKEPNSLIYQHAQELTEFKLIGDGHTAMLKLRQRLKAIRP